MTSPPRVTLVCWLNPAEGMEFYDALNRQPAAVGNDALFERVMEALQHVLPKEQVKEQTLGHVVGVRVGRSATGARWEYPS